jgi:hypothetical protein
MDNSVWTLYWRISSTSALLSKRHFFALGLPPVSLSDYKTFTQELPRSTGAISRQGYKNITLLWDELDFVQLKTLNGIVEASVTSGTIYATIDRAFGTKLANDFIDISGVPHSLTFSQMSNSRGVVYQNVTLVITNITITADPSSVL